MYDKTYYFNLIKELIKNHRDFLKFNEHLLERGVERRGLMRMMSFKNKMKVADNQKHILKTEDDLIGIFKLCEPLSSE